MRTIMIMMDSLNRHYLNAYGCDWVKTPNIDRLAAKAVTFDNHYCGSLPCMPARRDLMTGRLNFLETPWSPLQPYDECFVTELREQTGTYTHMITDHYHYWEKNGVGYNTVFDTWEFLRGQEGDPWKPMIKDPEVPEYRGKNRRQDWINRELMDLEDDEQYPTPQCFRQAVEFVERNHAEDNWHLHVEVFDPHEPFVAPARYRELYGDTWDGRYHFDWPDYAPVDPDAEGDPAIDHIRKCYAATVTRADVWLGKLLDAMDRHDMWKDTAVVLTTDHGHLLGEHGYWAKNYMFDYKELAHIPLIAYVPGAANNGKRVSALTTTIDFAPTFLELHRASPTGRMRGKSLVHLFERDEKHHDAVLYGYFGKDINMTDGAYTYTRQPVDGSVAHHHTAVPVNVIGNPDAAASAEIGRFLSYTELPVYRFAVPSRRHHGGDGSDLLFNIEKDPTQQNPITDDVLKQSYAGRLRELMAEHGAPSSQFPRVGM